jgi:hypothetical protein
MGGFSQDMGNSNYTLFMPREAFKMRTGAELVSSALHHLDIPSTVTERHDISHNDSKISFCRWSFSLLLNSPTVFSLTFGILTSPDPLTA